MSKKKSDDRIMLVSLRMTPQEFYFLRNLCKQIGRSKSAVIRFTLGAVYQQSPFYTADCSDAHLGFKSDQGDCSL